MAYKFYDLQIGAIFLTASGTEANATNLSCKLQAQGINRLRSNFKRIRLPDSIDGDPIFQNIEVGNKGKSLTITILSLEKTVFDQLIQLIESLIASGNTVNIKGQGATGDFDLNFVPDAEPYDFGEFRGTRVKNVVLRFVSR